MNLHKDRIDTQIEKAKKIEQSIFILRKHLAETDYKNTSSHFLGFLLELAHDKIIEFKDVIEERELNYKGDE